jgi:hypothetical protein
MQTMCQQSYCVTKLPKHCTAVQMRRAHFKSREFSSVNRADKVKETPGDFIVTELKHTIHN